MFGYVMLGGSVALLIFGIILMIKQKQNKRK